MFPFIAVDVLNIIAVILLLVVGPAIGNYACSVVYRLPRGQTPFEKHPYCGHCGTMLKPIDLFPIISFFMTRGKCRYCSGAIPAVYTVIELASTAIFIGYYFIFGIGEVYLINCAAAVFIVMMAAIAWAHDFIAAFLYVVAALLLLLVSSLAMGAAMPVIKTYIVLLVGGLALQWLYAKITRTPFALPRAHAAWWFALMGLVFPLTAVLWYGAALLVVVLLSICVSKRVAVHVGIPCVIVTMIAAANLV